jgi:acetoin utilization deacetylase AcuC-like enzyme
MSSATPSHKNWRKARPGASIYGNDYWNNQPFRNVRERHLHWLIQDGKPDILLYQAGADPLCDDQLRSHLKVSLKAQKTFVKCLNVN